MKGNWKFFSRIVTIVLSIILAYPVYSARAEVLDMPDNLLLETEATFEEPDISDQIPEESSEQQKKEKNNTDPESSEEKAEENINELVEELPSECHTENVCTGSEIPTDPSENKLAEVEEPEDCLENEHVESETPESQTSVERIESNEGEEKTTGEESKKAFLAFLKSGAVLNEKTLPKGQRVVTKKTVVLVQSSEEDEALIQYVVDDENILIIQSAWVSWDNLQPLTQEEQIAWNENEHLLSLMQDGFVLEPVQFEEEQAIVGDMPTIGEEDKDDIDNHVLLPTGKLNIGELSEEETIDESEDAEGIDILCDFMDDEEANTVKYIFEDGELTFQTATLDDALYVNPNLPPVRDQNPYGTCWAFSAVGAIEIDLIIDSVAGTMVDLSELFVAYFAAHNYPYAKNGGEDDNLEFDDGGEYLNNGGNNFIAFRLLENLIGVVEEIIAPYPDTTAQSIPAVYTPIAAQITGAYLLNTGDKNLIKQMILEHGAVSASLFMPSIYNEPYSAYGGKIGYNSSTCSLYGTTVVANHDILLVGWDDNYSRNNFISGLRPRNNGAWKVRNSWGNSWGTDGYFWVSYEDASLLGTEGTAYDAINSNSADEEMADYCYSYDKIPNPGGLDWENWLLKANDMASVSQSFIIDGNETILSVGTETGTPGVTIDVSVRVDGRDYSGSVYAKQKGFYRTKLDTPCFVETPMEAVVTVTYTSSGKEIIVPYEPANRTAWAGDYKYTTSSGSGGFTFNDHTIDGDACIKVYTRKEEAPGVTDVILSYGSQSGKAINISNAAVGATYQLEANVIAPVGVDKSLRWSSSAPAVAAVNDSGMVTVSENAQAGTTVITAITTDGVYATCTLTVPYVPTTGISIVGFSSKDFTIDDSNANGFKIGDALTIQAKLLPNGSMDRDVVWSSSNSDILAVKASGTVFGSNNPCCEVVFRKNGTARLTVSLRGNSAVKDYIVLTLNVTIPVESVTLNCSKTSMDIGDTVQLNANMQPSNATDKRVVWSSSDDTVATVNNNGTVKAIRYGTTIIKAETINGKIATCTITVRKMDPVEAFVYRMYRVCLLREPDPGGLEHWTGVLRRKEKTGAEVVLGFYLSAEMSSRGYTNAQYVTRAYEGILGRTPDVSGMRNWTKLLDQGVSYRYIVAGFANSSEFKTLCARYGIKQGTLGINEARDRNPAITGFVSRLYQYALGRKYDVSGLNNWCQKLLNNSKKQNFLNVALNGFLHSAEFVKKNHSDTEYVKILYRTFLGREAEEAGLQNWLKALRSGTSRDTVARRFADSAEFKRILASYGIK